MDGNWALAIISLLGAILAAGVSHGIMQAKVSRIEKALEKKVSTGEYNERQKAHEKELHEIKTEMSNNFSIIRHIESKVDQMTGKLDVMVALLKEHYQERDHHRRD